VAFARAAVRRNSSWWPRWTPSKFPIVTDTAVGGVNPEEPFTMFIRCLSPWRAPDFLP
jgi:hypothetical protein